MNLTPYLVKSERGNTKRENRWMTLSRALVDARARVYGDQWDRVQVENEKGQVVWSWRLGEAPR